MAISVSHIRLTLLISPSKDSSEIRGNDSAHGALPGDVCGSHAARSGIHLARFGAIAAVGESVVRFLKGKFVGFPGGAPVVEQVTTKSFQPSSAGSPTDFNSATGSLTLLLYRVDLDASQRGTVNWARGVTPGAPPQKRHGVALDLRYLITAWAEQPDKQQLILGKALASLDAHATFAFPDLVDQVGAATAIWSPDESFQFIPDDMATEDLYQIWESLGHSFELSVPYRARVIRLEASEFDGEGDVLERHLGYGKALPDAPEEVS
jgi:hypothetical protein